MQNEKPPFKNKTHSSWHKGLKIALDKIPASYWQTLKTEPFLPKTEDLFNAFSLPLTKVNYVLFGETPYPRSASANGYAFYDAAVNAIWSETGLSTAINRATSLRNLIKMLLVSEKLLDRNQTSQTDIAALPKEKLISTLGELFSNFNEQGFLLLNASLVLRPKKKTQDTRIWQPFIQAILKTLHEERPHVKLILFGRLAEKINALPEAAHFKQLIAEHPYNHSFITNKAVLDFFEPFALLRKK